MAVNTTFYDNKAEKLLSTAHVAWTFEGNWKLENLQRSHQCHKNLSKWEIWLCPAGIICAQLTKLTSIKPIVALKWSLTSQALRWQRRMRKRIDLLILTFCSHYPLLEDFRSRNDLQGIRLFPFVAEQACNLQALLPTNSQIKMDNSNN